MGEVSSKTSDEKTGLARIAEARKVYEAAIEKTGKEAIVEELKGFFEKHPDALAIRWNQYTPHFNDGEPCTFGVHFHGIRVEEKPESGGDYDDGFLDSWDLKSRPVLANAAKYLDSLLRSNKDVLESAFGDGYEVTVTRDGKVEVEEHEHD